MRNQNFTDDLVFFNTLNIIILKNRSYKWPDATENMLIVSSGDLSGEPELKELYIYKTKQKIIYNHFKISRFYV